ncbi:MAG: hypothetical protein QXE05_08685 [Nitrososphaeria archaeon]
MKKKAHEKNNLLAPLDLRLLDPACGSGTFLVLAISRLRSYIEEHWIDKGVALKRITKNIVGFDLNPLAIIAARSNYLIALGDMLREKGTEPIEIPVYMADSILTMRRQTLTTNTYVLKTSVGELEVPTKVIEKGLLAKVLSLVEECILGGYNINEFRERLLRETDLDEPERSYIEDLFKTLSRLEKEGKNRIWTRILKNSFAPLFLTYNRETKECKGNFDYVVGNPPWINWESLPEDYRNSTKSLWENYNLLEKTKGMGLGKVKRDLSSLFLVRCFDRYLVDDGNLAFLMPFTLLKTHASAGFRKFIAFKGQVTKVHDLVELFPFEGAINRTCLIHSRKSDRTTFPIPCIMWKKADGKSIPTESRLEDVIKNTKQFTVALAPVKKYDPGTPWMIITEKAYDILQKVMMPAKYRAYEGVNTGGLDGAYYINILSKQGENFILVQNMHDTGSKKLNQLQTVIESDKVYPLVRGRDVKKWFFEYNCYIIIPTDEKGQNIPIQEIKLNYPKLYKYFLNFEKELKNRSVYKLVGEKQNIWYGLYVDIGDYTFGKYKVVWKNVAGKISGKAEFSAAVIGPVKDEFLGEKIVIPNVKLMFIPVEDEDEAHYICAFLNTSIARLIVASYVIETGISTHVLQNLFIPKFNREDKRHKMLSDLSKKAHELAKQNQEDELKKVEDKMDEIVAEIYGLTNNELDEVKKCLMMLAEGEVQEEEKEEPTLEEE